jgi:ADP-ribosylglycohydrolase
VATDQPSRPWVQRARGLVLGMALGDGLTWAGNRSAAGGVLRCSCSMQLLAFTLEGLIRASVRWSHKGICHPPSVVWFAYRRWAALQRIPLAPGAFPTKPDVLNGWLATVTLLGERRGSAPATVAALTRTGMGTPDKPSTTSRGAHAAVRGLVVGMLGWPVAGGHWTSEQVAQLGREVGALTHGDRRGYDAAALAALLAAACGQTGGLGPAVERTVDEAPAQDIDPRLVEAMLQGWRSSRQEPADAARLRRLVPDRSAQSAIAGGVYAATSFDEAGDAAEPFGLLSRSGVSGEAAAFAGALIGAVRGVDGLPADRVSRLELAWVLDTLATDLITELTEHPSGSEYDPATDPRWWSRYPGW